MAIAGQTLDKATWDRAYERVCRLPAQRQAEIVDFIDFVAEREEEEEWELSEDELADMRRHREGDLSDTVSLQDVREAILEGREEEI